jgi:hypothetical protein
MNGRGRTRTDQTGRRRRDFAVTSLFSSGPLSGEDWYLPEHNPERRPDCHALDLFVSLADVELPAVWRARNVQTGGALTSFGSAPVAGRFLRAADGSGDGRR